MKKIVNLLTIGIIALGGLLYTSSSEAHDQPTITEFTYEYSGCQGYTPRFILMWNASSHTQVLEYDLDYDIWWQGNWHNSYNGTNTAKMFYGQHDTPTQVRVRARNAKGWGAFKSMNLPNINCHGGGPIIK